jgi:hypothetical protein
MKYIMRFNESKKEEKYFLSHEGGEINMIVLLDQI